MGLLLSSLLSAPAPAQTIPFTATGWVNGVLAPGILCTNGSGQLLIRGNVHTARVQGTDPRFTGQALIISQGGNNADGTFSMQDTSYLQVGTWDAAGTNFMPMGGMWEMNWRGVMQTNFSMQLNQTGYGSGGTIEGLRLEETVTRGPASGPIDFTVRLSWPAPARVNYAVAGAPSVLGPWLPVQELSLPGLQQITVPATEAAQFFRLLQVP